MWFKKKLQNFLGSSSGAAALANHLYNFQPVSCISSAVLLRATNNLCIFEISPLKCNTVKWKEKKNKHVNCCSENWNYCKLQLTPQKIQCCSKCVAKQTAREANILLYLQPNTRPTIQHLSPVTLPYMLIFFFFFSLMLMRLLLYMYLY